MFLQNDSADKGAASSLHQYRRPHGVGQNSDFTVNNRGGNYACAFVFKNIFEFKFSLDIY
jgi:hypothetical protein